MRAYERLLNYVKIYTTSDEESSTVPTTMRQFDLANVLVEEMKKLGISDARVEKNCYVYGTIPATPGYEENLGIGFIAHLDTAPDFCGENVRPMIWENYDGTDVVLGESGRVLSVEQFPHLKNLKGRTLITTDGTTLLGADDKAGVAEIMTMAEELLKGDIPHGKISIAFTPDEEVGSGAAELDIPTFGAAYAYTVDGGSENGVEYENFNACSAQFEINGFNIHPGDSKDKMLNAALIAMEINGMLTDMEGTVEHANLQYIVRDHDGGHFRSRQEMLRHIEKILNEKYGAGTVKLTLHQQYRNMKEKMEPCMHLIDNAKNVIRELGMEPEAAPVRGGTDGAQLSFRGLPCPNLGTGGYAYHGPYEHITAEGMDIVVKILLGIVDKYTENSSHTILNEKH